MLRSVVAATVMVTIGGQAAAESCWHPLMVGLVMVLATDFCIYWVHRVHHEAPALWPFHAVHHSAEVLTPLTVYRKHPIYDFISDIVRSIVLGALQGMLLAMFVGKIALTHIAGVNAFYFFFNALGSNLRHSQVWLSYGPVLERILISPAQHQIHHSSAVHHHNRNYGEIFAVWDWMFGALYLPEVREELEFGLADAHGNRQPQPHPTLSNALVVPLVESWSILSRRSPAHPHQEHESSVSPIVPSS